MAGLFFNVDYFNLVLLMKQLSTIALLFLISHFGFSQEYKLNKENSQISIIGTSNIHDWACVVENFDITASIEGTTISSIAFEAKVKSIKSGKSGMDNNVYAALKEKQNPKIYFKSEKIEIQASKIKGKGALTIAGETRQIDIELGLEQTSTNNYVISGAVVILMTDYNVTPPTAVFGTIKTGDQISLEVVLTISK
ncbi:MAG: YceI family protein [Reichenbachiella sp.]